jgi:hypothetical protein
MSKKIHQGRLAWIRKAPPKPSQHAKGSYVKASDHEMKRLHQAN